MDNFDCCSHFVECSDKGSCLFANDDSYAGCSYNKNLIKRIIFYGSRKGQSIATDTDKVKPIENIGLCDKTQKSIGVHDKIYLDCYNRNFKINRLGGNGFSYPLTQEELKLIVTAFDNKVPYCHETGESKCIREGNNLEPANSRVIFTFEEYNQEFVIANYDACFILKRFADGIRRALVAKGISARVELIGTYAKVTEYPKQRFA